jgi:CDP-glucose 4,6-dehydratase
VPDALHAFSHQQTLQLRRPGAVRPWQHVLEPLQGYILLAERLLAGDKVEGAWNFGPDEQDCITVGDLCSRLASRMPEPATIEHGADATLHEAGLLKLDSARARNQLGWHPRWRLDAALDATTEWHRQWLANADMHRVTLDQIVAYENA